MKKKLLAFDLEGTLVKHNDGPNNSRSILKRDKDSLKRLNMLGKDE